MKPSKPACKSVFSEIIDMIRTTPKPEKARTRVTESLYLARETGLDLDETEPRRPSPATLARTHTLLLAALRVWELKNGIGDN